MRRSLQRIPIYILLIVCLQLNSCHFNRRQQNILSLAAPFNLLAQEDYDYINNESANVADDDSEALNEFLNINLPQMNVDTLSVPPVIPLLKDEEQHQNINSMASYDSHSQQLERNKLSPMQNRPMTENKLLNIPYEDGNSNTINVGAGAGTGVGSCVSTIGNGNVNDHKEQADEQQEVIDHVTNLIKSMREHAIGIIKDMNDLEMDFLYSTGGGDAGENKNCNDFNQEPSTTTTTSSPSMCIDFNTTPPPPPTISNCFNNSNKWSSNIYSNNKNNDNCGNNNNNEKKMNMPNYFVNEWSAPMTNTNPGVDAKEFMQQAHEAVKSWREQIEACKQILDAAVSQATQTRHATNGVFTGVSDSMRTDQTVANTLTKNRDGDTIGYSGERSINNGNSGLNSANNFNNNNNNDKMKKQSNIMQPQHTENIAQNYEALINTLRARGVPNVLDVPPFR